MWLPLGSNNIWCTVAFKYTVMLLGSAYSNKSAAVCLFPFWSKMLPPTLVP
ncbi:hypothetical protein Hanom_Chr14g01333821 [Helianthus anomalus]